MFNKMWSWLKAYIKANYAFLIIIVLIIVLFWIKIPYVIYAPGGLIPLDKRVEIETTNKQEGSLNMTYVTMMEGNIFYYLLGQINRNWSVVKQSDVTLDNESIEEMSNRDHLYMEQSIDNAVISAYDLANKDLYITTEENVVIYVFEEAVTGVKEGDILISADNLMIDTVESYIEYVSTKNKGDIINLTVKRKEKLVNETIKVIEIDGQIKTGLAIITLYEYNANPSIRVTIDTKESGPSGGLMMAVQIYNKLAEEDITKGRLIAGTGTIDAKGNVGEIGGISYKVLTAIKNDVDVFIVPDANCKESKEILNNKKNNLKLICTNSLENVIEQLAE